VEAGEQCDDGNTVGGDGCSATCQSESSWVVVGSYEVDDGASWGSNPPCYTCREACAVVFGGSSSQYQCSTTNSSINNQARSTTWGISGCGLVADTYKKNTYYNCGGSNCSTSCYVQDNCQGASGTNWCWKYQ
jgi:cysteine-rich repeat protein